MKEDSGNMPYDPFRPPGHEPLPGANGPPAERVVSGDPPLRPSLVPQIAPGEAPAVTNPPARLPTTVTERKTTEVKDPFREIVETVVFVVVLVLLLRSFMAEAFVIPTGSMATTLLGYHRDIECPECGFRFPLNLSKELDSQETNPQRVTGCECPNCRLRINATNSNQFSSAAPQSP